MRIDFHYGPQSTPEADRRTSERREVAAGAPNNKNILSESDQAHISTGLAQVQALAAEVLQAPDAREKRVRSLQEAVRSGQYQADAQATASALLRHMTLGSVV